MSEPSEKLYHGGAPGLNVGDRLVPIPNGRGRDGCPICEARTSGQTVTLGGEAIDPPTGHEDAVYVTTDRLTARHYASLAAGDLYRVQSDQLERSDEDPLIVAYRCPSAVIVGVVERAVRLTDSERRRLWRRMGGKTSEWYRMRAQMPAVMAELAKSPPA